MIQQPKKKLDFFPLRKDLANYSWNKMKADFQAGLNVALLDFPQAMAYALLAGFPVTFGVYTSAIASLVGPLFASSRYVMLGVTNATAVLLLSYFLTLDMEPGEKLMALPVLVLLVGLFMILGAFLRLAMLIKYVSRTVITGFISAAALLVIVNQIHTVLGTPDVHAGTFFEALSKNIIQWDLIQLGSVLVASITGLIYILVSNFLRPVHRVIFTLVLSSLIAYGLTLLNFSVIMLEPVALGTWPISVPALNFEIISHMGGIAIAVAFLAILESSTIARTLAARSGNDVDLNQHMLSMGVANVSSAFVSGMPVSGSLTRSILNYSSGARTACSSIFSGLLMMAGVMLAGPLIGFIPKAGLATIVIIVGLSLINLENIRIVVRSTNSDAVVFLVTFIGGLLFPLSMAIGLGASASIILFLSRISEPNLVQYTFNNRGMLSEKKIKDIKEIPEISIVHVEGELFFGSTDIFLEQTRLICDSPNLKVIILRIRKAHQLDASSVMAISDLIRFVKEKHRSLVVSGANEQVERVFREAGVMKLLGENNFFRHTPSNPNLCTRYAVKRAKEIVGFEQANVTLFLAEHPNANNQQNSANAVIQKTEEEGQQSIAVNS